MSAAHDEQARVLPHDAEHYAARRGDREPGWLAELRERAISSFTDLGIPTTRLEEWRYTNVSALTRETYSMPPASDAVTREALDRAGVPDLGGDRLVFRDGRFAPDASLRHTDGLELRSLAEALEETSELSSDSPLLELGRSADSKDDAFTSLNTAWADDGAIVVVPRGCRIEKPIQLVFLSSSHATPTIYFPRIVVIAREGSEATVVQDHVSLGSAAGTTVCSDAVSEIVTEANASLRVLVVQREAGGTIHIARQAVRQARDSRLWVHTFNLGGSIVRNDLRIALEDEGASCDLLGLYLGGGDQLIDNHTLVDHAMPGCSSRELYKGILGDDARGVFRGRVVVRPDAQKTDASQQNSNLLVSAGAEVDTKPQLEIYADDVKCSHGSSIGQLDPESLFFMRSRGLSESAARALLTEGFASEISESLPEDAVGSWIRELVTTRVRELYGRRSGNGGREGER